MPPPSPPPVPEPREPRYAIEWRPSAVRALRKLDRHVARRITAAIGSLSEQPRPHGVKAMTGLPGALRLRVGEYRIVYEVHDGTLVVLVLALGPRGDVYRRL